MKHVLLVGSGNIARDYAKVLNKLEAVSYTHLKTDAEAVLTPFHTVDMKTGKRTPYALFRIDGKSEITLDEMMAQFDLFSPCCTFHGLMYRTDLYVQSNIQLSEGIFYEDQEYATLPFSYVKRIFILPIYFYQYQLGNGEQSVSFQNLVKRKIGRAHV